MIRQPWLGTGTFSCCCSSHNSILCLHLCHSHSEWLWPWILLSCYFRPWSDLMPRSVSWQLKGKRPPLLGGKAKGRKERGWWALSINSKQSKQWLSVSAKHTSLGLSQISHLRKVRLRNSSSWVSTLNPEQCPSWCSFERCFDFLHNFCLIELGVPETWQWMDLVQVLLMVVGWTWLRNFKSWHFWIFAVCEALWQDLSQGVF